jgi:ferredoxin
MKHAQIVYYTGTGNTLRALSIIAGELGNAGWTVSMTDMGTGSVPPAPGQGDMLILGFPTLGFSPPASVPEYIARLPRPASATPEAETSTQAHAAIVCACGSSLTKSGRITGGWSGTASMAAAAALGKRGYATLASADISYTENWTQMGDTHDGKTRKAMTAAGDAEAKTFGADLAAGRFRVVRRGFAGKAFGIPAGWIFPKLARRVLARLYVADSSCTGCGLCAKICPAAAIGMRAGRPSWNLKCTACNRCINACPSRSIQSSTARLVLVGGANILLAIVAWPIAGAAIRAALPSLAGAFPGAGAVAFILHLALAFALYAAASLVQLGPLDRIMQAVERQPGCAGIFLASRSKKFTRYLAPGFRPGEKPYR